MHRCRAVRCEKRDDAAGERPVSEARRPRRVQRITDRVRRAGVAGRTGDGVVSRTVMPSSVIRETGTSGFASTFLISARRTGSDGQQIPR